jgi:hypothetical protein
MNVLVLYYSRQHPLRTAVSDHLYSLDRYTEANCFYVNVGMPGRVDFLRSVEFDLVVFHTILLWERVNPLQFRAALSRVDWVADLACPKVILPQDEHLHGDELAWLIGQFGVTHVMSCAQEDQWDLLYPEVDREHVDFATVLTGYLSDDTLERIGRILERSASRDIDVGYRAWDPWPSLGRHGLLKTEIGRRFLKAAQGSRLVLDISNNASETFVGDSWFEFLARCKYTIGVEGGASVLDYRGEIMRCTQQFTSEHPNATFGQVEAECFPGSDGSVAYFALSPRHLEACATRTCQVLVEGSYNGILQPGIHYIPMKPDFSDIEDVVELVRSDEARERIVARAYEDVVASRRWSYGAFAHQVVGCATTSSRRSPLRLMIARARDRVLWRVWSASAAARRSLERLVGAERVAAWVRAVKRALGEVR